MSLKCVKVKNSDLYVIKIYIHNLYQCKIITLANSKSYNKIFLLKSPLQRTTVWPQNIVKQCNSKQNLIWVEVDCTEQICKQTANVILCNSIKSDTLICVNNTQIASRSGAFALYKKGKYLKTTNAPDCPKKHSYFTF